MDSPLIWFAAAAVLVGSGLVLLSLSMNAAKRAQGEQAGGPAADLESGKQALFIDEPLETDLAAALAGKAASREAGRLHQGEPAEEVAREPGEAAQVRAVSTQPVQTPISGSPDHDGDDSSEHGDEDDTLETEAPNLRGTRPRKRPAVHAGKKAAGKGDKGKRPRSKPGLFPPAR